MKLWTTPPPASAWPDTNEADRVRALWAPALEHGAAWVAPNVGAEAGVLIGDGHVMPVTASVPAIGNSYVVSAAGLYLHYARYEAGRLKSPMEKTGSLALLGALGPLLRRLDPVVMLDNLPLSTNLRSGARFPDVWAAALEAVRRAWPGHAVVVRSLDTRRSGVTLFTLELLGFRRILSRRVFFQDPSDPQVWRRRDVKRDRALEQAHPLDWKTLTPTDAPAVADLYWQLYGDKYTPLNPRFSPAWLAAGLEGGALRGEGLMEKNRMIGVYGSVEAAGVVTQPVVGYTTALPPEAGLYRRLMLRALEQARERGLLLHASAGAARFKLARGGVPAEEYLAVHTAGCPPVQRAAWATLAALSARVGARLLEASD